MKRDHVTNSRLSSPAVQSAVLLMATGGQTTGTLNTLVIGGTGATGRHLVGTLLRAKDVVAKVTVLGRRKLESVPEQYGADLSVEESEGRLVQHVEDLDTVKEETVKELCTGGHVFFNCLGTTRRAAGSAEAFRHIDFEIPTRLTRLAKDAGVVHCSVLTSWGANPNGWLLYTRTKGEVEGAAREMEFPYTSIFRPGALNRGVGGFTDFLGKLLNSTPVAVVAEAMAQDAYTYHAKGRESEEGAATPEVTIFSTAQIRQLARQPPAPKEPAPAQTSE